MAQSRSGLAVARPPSIGDWLAAALYAALIVLTYFLGLGLGTLAGGRRAVHPLVSDPVLFPGLFVLAPPVVAVLNLRRGGSVPGNVAVGVVPGLAFALLAAVATLLGTGNGDSPVWALSLTFAGIGLVGALTGTAAYLIVDRLGRVAR